MESSASDVSQDGSESSSADSTSADSPVQALPNMSGTEIPAQMVPFIDNDAPDSDSDSDISMSAETDDEENEGQTTSIILVNPLPQLSNQSADLEPSQNTEGSKKRKFSDSTEVPKGQARNGMIIEVRKRLKPDDALQKLRTTEGHLPKDKSLLPAEIWHHIFTFCPPRVLGRLVQVKKSFNAYLDPSSSGLSVDSLSTSAVHLLSPDAIWRASRQVINLHGLPAPLSGKSELDMWNISCGSLCQFCGKTRQKTQSVLTDQWHPGPGENGVVPIWSFGIRTCGSCLQKQSTKVGLSLIGRWLSITE